MTHILHRSANAVMPVAVGGKGIELFDNKGTRYIDASGGARSEERRVGKEC